MSDLTSYLDACVRSIVREAEHRVELLPPDRQDLLDEAAALLTAQGLGTQQRIDAYEKLARAKAAACNRVAEIARCYDSMAEFWADAAAQEVAGSNHTFWDTYEHGMRRQLEGRLARSFGSAGSVLVNSGMTAIDCVFGGLRLRPGDIVAAHVQSYFETTQYFEDVLAPRGVVIRRYDFRDPGDVARLIAEAPRAVIFEPVLNTSGVDVPHALTESGAGLPRSTVVCVDNSLTSHGLPWEVWAKTFPGADVLVVESAIKYLTGRCSAGVVYGGPLLDDVRTYARRVGVNLQERAFNHLVWGELDHCADRVRLHAEGAAEFAGALDPAHWGSVRVAHTRLPEAGSATGVLFCTPAGDLADADRLALLPGRWRAEAAVRGLRVDVRAGFGWTRTSGRSYGADALNQADGKAFLRISVGLEPLQEIHGLAAALDAATRHLTDRQPHDSEDH